MEAPPPTLKASTTLSERESTEVEVISKWTCFVTSCTFRMKANNKQSCLLPRTTTLSSELWLTWFPRPLCIPLFSTSLHTVSCFERFTDRFQIHQGWDATWAAREYVPYERTGRVAQGERLHRPPTKRVPTDGGESFSCQRDCQPGAVSASGLVMNSTIRLFLSCVSEVLRYVSFYVCMSFRSQVESFFFLLTIPLPFLLIRGLEQWYTGTPYSVFWE